MNSFLSTLSYVTQPRHSEQPPTDAPLAVARQLSLQGPQGTVFGPIDLTLPRGAAVALVGEAGAGKSALLLALTGRMRGVTGELVIDGHDALRHPRRVQKLTSVARLDELITPEGSLSLEDCITERTLADAAPARSRLANYLHVAQLMGLKAPRGTLYGRLSPADQARAALALASIRPASMIVFDDVDRETTLAEQELLWQGLQGIAAEGVTVVASTSERAAVPPGVTTIEMETVHAG